MRFDSRGSSGFSWRGPRGGAGTGFAPSAAGAVGGRADFGFPRSVRGRWPPYSASVVVRNAGLPPGLAVRLSPSPAPCRGRSPRFAPPVAPPRAPPAAPPVVPPVDRRREAGSAAMGRPRRDSLEAGAPEGAACPGDGAARASARGGLPACAWDGPGLDGGRAWDAVPPAGAGAATGTTGAGEGDLCRSLRNCARLARDDGALGVAVAATGVLETLSVIRAMGVRVGQRVLARIIAGHCYGVARGVS